MSTLWAHSREKEHTSPPIKTHLRLGVALHLYGSGPLPAVVAVPQGQRLVGGHVDAAEGADGAVVLQLHLGRESGQYISTVDPMIPVLGERSCSEATPCAFDLHLRY